MDWSLFVNQACVFLFLTLITLAALTDMQRFIIPNYVSVALIALYVPFALTNAQNLPVIFSTASAVGLLVIGFVLFQFHIFGAGDAKLIAAIGLWTTPLLLTSFLLYTAVFGGVLALIIAAYHYKDYFLRRGLKPSLKGVNIPYGVAISAGGYAVGIHHLNFSYLGV